MQESLETVAQACLVKKAKNLPLPSVKNCMAQEKEPMMTKFQLDVPVENKSSEGDNGTQSPNEKKPSTTEEQSRKEDNKSVSEAANSVSKKVEAYIKEHIRPLCKSGVINVEQYRWAVAKTTDKVLKYHSNSKNASFLIKEGEKVKKLAEQYVEAAAQHKDSS